MRNCIARTMSQWRHMQPADASAYAGARGEQTFSPPSWKGNVVSEEIQLGQFCQSMHSYLGTITQILSRSNLKRRSVRFFEERRPAPTWLRRKNNNNNDVGSFPDLEKKATKLSFCFTTYLRILNCFHVQTKRENDHCSIKYISTVAFRYLWNIKVNF